MSQPRKSRTVEFEAEVLQNIRRHARSSMDAEICGVLIGCQTSDRVVIAASIPGEHAARGGAHVTFTQETWEHIYRVKDREYPDRSIVGWYHSHPGFGVFLSDYDLFIHKNFFAAPHQVAWVFDPHSDEEGCFAWNRKKVQPLRSFTVVNQRAATVETPRPEPEGGPPPILRRPRDPRWEPLTAWGRRVIDRFCARFVSHRDPPDWQPRPHPGSEPQSNHAQPPRVKDRQQTERVTD